MFSETSLVSGSPTHHTNADMGHTFVFVASNNSSMLQTKMKSFGRVFVDLRRFRTKSDLYVIMMPMGCLDSPVV